MLYLRISINKSIMKHNTISLFITAGIFVGVWSNFLYHIGTIPTHRKFIEIDADTRDDILK